MRFFILLILNICITTLSFANMAVLKNLPDAQKIGTYSYSYLLWDVYDIALYKDNKKNLALTLSYKRDLSGKDISQRSIDEIKKIGFKDKTLLTKWQKQMDDLFPDVTDSTVLTGIRKNNKALFYKNGIYLGVIDDAEFAHYFFDIWLSSNTSEPKMRKALLGQK